MKFLIDGYNLAHRLTLPAGRISAERLAESRDALLRHLAARHGDASGSVTVVFDCSRSFGVPAREIRHGIDVRNALGETADDLIERLIAGHEAPRALTVVSDDRRIKSAARRRHCRALGCDFYLEELDRPVRPPRTDRPDKPADGDPAADAALLAALSAAPDRRSDRRS